VARIAGKHDADQALAKLGAAIRARRVSLGVSQEALADAAGIDRSHMGKIERGERNVTLLNLVRIAGALQSPLADVMLSAGL
jgi:transcriptional regulator with XRE-family HTH domain